MGFGKDGRGAIVIEAREQALGTLASNTGLLIGTDVAITEDFRMLKTEISAVVHTNTLGELGSLELYLVEGKLSLAEAEAAIESEGPLSRHDPTKEAIAERPVFRVGAGPVGGGTTPKEFHIADVMTGGPVCVAKPRWTWGETSSWSWMVYNRGAAPTTGASVNINAKSFGVWLH